VFQATCAACHKLYAEGGDLGPDLTGSNRADLDYVLHNILDPNAEIPNAYRAARVELNDGRVLTGIVESPSGVVMSVQTPDARVAVPRADVKAIVQSDVSMMPEGLLAPLGDEDVRHLVAYLRSRWQVPLPPAR
jgi:putative heme-binding domain-containing protein